MERILRLENAALMGLGLAAFSQLDLSWWWFVGLILAPDVSMVGYLVGPRAGAFSYNLVHHLAVAVLVGGLGWALGSLVLQVAGVILFTHASMDRALGYGLKYPDDFRHTHLGWIGGGPDKKRKFVRR